MRFTIVTPSFNQLEWLELCIASVSDQRDVEAIEHLVCDAGSDGIEAFREKMLERLPETSRYRLEFVIGPDAGMYDAINKGLRRATGEICAYLNCDEQYLPGTLSAVAEWFGRNRAREVAFGDIVVVRPDGSYICDRTAMVPTKLHTLVSGNLAVFSAATFFRSEAVLDRGLLFSPDWKVVGDSVWILSLLDAGLSMGLLRRRVASFIYSGENLSLDAKGTEERNRLRSKACAGARAFASVIVALFRLRRMLGGGYSLAALGYTIYTSTSAHARLTFQVERPTHRWPTHRANL
jgi:glycosyltransferase involved in cell wall biosynthesis